MKAKINTKKTTSSNKKTNSIKDSEVLPYVYLAANAIEEKKGENIVLLDVSKLTVLSDYFIVTTANSSVQIQAIAKYVEETLRESGVRLVSKEGFVQSNWVVLDFGNLVVHVMSEKEREFYKLERFWGNAIVIENKKWKKAS